MTLHCAAKADYAFLAHPPLLKKGSKQPLYVDMPSHTSRRRSNTFSGIVAWAAHVEPGSPAPLSPHSPHHCPSLGRGCCPSITSIRAASTSFLHVTPIPTTVQITTPSVSDFKTDLTAVGYTSIFFQLPNTPISATLSFSIKPPSSNAAKSFPNLPIHSPSCKPRSLTRFRSLSVLQRGRPKSVIPNSLTKMKAKDAVASAAIIKRKKSKYDMRPPPLANELALMQFADGGSMGNNIKRVIQTQAKATGTVSHGDVHRDDIGGIWLDQDEELEYAYLLAEDDSCRLQHPQWVTFGSHSPSFATRIAEDERRESVSTQSAELNPNRMVQLVDLLGGDDPALFGNTPAPPVTRTPGLSVLAIPSRPNRPAKHLQNPNFLVDAVFSHPHASPIITDSLNSRSGADVGFRKKERKRPGLLKLAPPSPAFKWPANSPIDNYRQDFIQSSFQPTPGSALVAPVAISDTTQLDVRMGLAGSNPAIHMSRQTRTANGGSTRFGMKTKQSVFNLKGLFRSGRK